MSSTVISRLLGKNELDREMLLDSVSKFRVSTPESLIDTDFEYGLQGVKWETLQLVNNLPTFFSRTGDAPIPLADVTTRAGVEYVYVTTQSNHGLIDGQPILIQGLRSPYAEGYFTVNKVLSPSNFAYRTSLPQLSTGTINDNFTSALYPGQYYQGTGLTQQQILFIHTNSNNPSQLNVNTIFPHGFSNGTAFNIVNSVGRRILTFAGTSVTGGSNISIPGHNLVDGTIIRYNKNLNASALVGLTDGANYFVTQTTSNLIRLSASSNLTPLVTGLGTAGTDHQFITNDDATDGSFYTIASIPTQSNFLLQAPFQILPNTYTIDPSINVNLFNSMIEFNQLHKAQTGAQVVYSTGGGTAFGGLTNNTTYFTIRQDTSNIRLATTYSNAVTGTFINMSAGTLGTGTAHTFTFHGIDGEVVGTGTVSLSNTSNIAWGSNLNFLSMVRPDEKLLIEVPVTPASYSVSVAGSVFTVGANLTTGTPLKFLGSATAGLVNNYIYYARNLSATTVSLHPTPTDATNNTNAISPTGASGTLQNRSQYTSIFEPLVWNVLSSTRVSLQTPATVTASNLKVLSHTGVFPFMDGLVLHRAMDGGVELVPSNNEDAQVIRQTRRYFRYQPGKGIQCSLSVNFNAPIDVDYASYNSGTGKVTVFTKKPHRMTTGLQITMDNQVAAYRGGTWTGVYTVTVTNITSFEYTPSVAPSPAVAPGLPIFWVNGWSNSRIRAGLFDDQNGMFFEFDGSTLYAVRRDSVTQISGYSSVTYGSPMITGVQNTAYLTQIVPKQMVVIKGMSYKVAFVESDTVFYVQPPYRGVSDNFCMISLTTDTRTPSSQWNLDKCDGTGPTGYVLDPRRIQMIYYDYSWYGAGAIRFGFKDPTGEVRYVHKYIHNNQFTTAYFRAGNLPARYEIQNVGAPTWVPPLLHWGTSVIMDGRYDDDKAYLFTAPGNVLSFTNGDQIVVSCTIPSNTTRYTIYDPYTQTSQSAWAILSAGTGTSRYIDVQNLRPNTPISGNNLPAGTLTIGTPQKDNIDANKALIFINRQPTAASGSANNYTIGITTDIIPSIIPIVSLRVAPSVDTSIGGLLGARELINRMQLRLRSVDLMTTNDTEIRLILNPVNDNTNWVAATSPSLSQLIFHNKNDTTEGGTVIFSYRVPGGIFDSSGKRTSQVQSYDISALGSLGNSIMGGNGVYPNGTDVLTVAAVCLEAGGVAATTPYTLSARLTWAENQS